MSNIKEANPILNPQGEPREPWNRLYVLVDSIDQLAPEGAAQVVRMDGVQADYFDAFDGEIPIGEGINRAPLAILELFTEDQDASYGASSTREVLQPGEWLEVEFDPGASEGIRVDYYSNLFGNATSRYARNIRRVDPVLSRKLGKAFSLADVSEADEHSIQTVIDGVGELAFINVLDVGQGNANALWQDGGGVALYFDFGGGVGGNTKTFPAQFTQPCFSNRPPIVLSHWDWDHWSSGVRFPGALDSIWIAPRQQIGPVHRAFAWLLHSRRNLFLWPTNCSDMSGPSLQVARCTGRDRNNSGLSVVVQRTLRRGAKEAVLLSGDADYTNITACATKQFGAAVVSHHGGIGTGHNTVRPTGPTSQLVYSVGHGNTYGHPKLQALLEHLVAGWIPAHTFSTAQHSRNRPCHIAIVLNRKTPTTGCMHRNCEPKVVAR